MKTLKNLVKTEKLNIEELMMIKGAAEPKVAAGCGSYSCQSGACNTSSCGSKTCDSYACKSGSCSGSTCETLACGSNMDYSR